MTLHELVTYPVIITMANDTVTRLLVISSFVVQVTLHELVIYPVTKEPPRNVLQAGLL